MIKENKILIVEDDEGDLEYIQEYLSNPDLPSRLGVRYTMDTAVRMAESLELLGKNAYDLVLLDLSLPDSTGLDSLIKVREKSPEVPIIILTGLHDLDTSVKAMEKGASHYFVKGFIDRDELVRNMNEVIDNFGNRRGD
ncbi:response regulator [Fibrobacterota bacterium]